MRYTDVEIQYDASDTSITDDTVTKNLNYTSDSNGDFSTNPTVTITFTNAHPLLVLLLILLQIPQER